MFLTPFLHAAEDAGLLLAFWLEYIAPALRADFPFNRCARARRLKQFALVALLGAFRRILIRGLLLCHLGLRRCALNAQDEEAQCAQSSGRREPAETAS